MCSIKADISTGLVIAVCQCSICLFVDRRSQMKLLRSTSRGIWSLRDIEETLQRLSLFSVFQIMLLTDPEVESSLLISSDEGATYQKYRLNFYILSLLFHPEQEDWILAYGHDQKVQNHFS